MGLLPRPVKLIQFSSDANMHLQDVNGDRITYAVEDIQLRRF